MARRGKDIDTSEQRKIADKLLRNFLLVFIVAFGLEIFMRASALWFLPGAMERRWIEWLLVSLLGICAYLLWNVAIWYQRPHADFKAFRPWYRATAARGPILALVVLIALTNINFQVQLPAAQGAGEEETAAGQVDEGDQGQSDSPAPPSTFEFGVNFQEASEQVLLVAAFLVGFYSRLAKAILEEIARFLFGDLFDRTYQAELSNREYEKTPIKKKRKEERE